MSLRNSQADVAQRILIMYASTPPSPLLQLDGCVTSPLNPNVNSLPPAATHKATQTNPSPSSPPTLSMWPLQKTTIVGLLPTRRPFANALIQPPYSKGFLILSCVWITQSICTVIDLAHLARNFLNFSTMYMRPRRISLFKIYLHFVSSITKAVLLKIKKSFSCIASIFWLMCLPPCLFPAI